MQAQQLKPFADGGGPDYRVIDEARIIELMLSMGWAYEVRFGERARAEAEARSALNHCVAIGLQFETAPDGGRLFDAVEVINFIDWAGLGGLDPSWERHFGPTGQRLALDMHPTRSSNATGLLPRISELPPQRFSITLERTYNLRSCPTRSRVRLRLPLPLEDEALSDLKLTILPPANVPGIEYSSSVGRLDAVLRNFESDYLTLGVRASFTAHALPRGNATTLLSEADRDLYTQPREGLVQVTPRIRSLAARLVGTAVDPLEKVKRLWNFVIDNLMFGSVRYDQVPPLAPLDWLLDRGWGDCQLGTALLVALCRTQGIPARMSSGYPLYALMPRYHYWGEVWLEGRGWLPFDCVSWGLSFGGRDAAWRDYYFGVLDYRCRMECLPLVFSGVSSVRLPAVWQLLSRPLANGVEVGFWSPAARDYVYVDRIQIHEPVREVVNPAARA